MVTIYVPLGKKVTLDTLQSRLQLNENQGGELCSISSGSSPVRAVITPEQLLNSSIFISTDAPPRNLELEAEDDATKLPALLTQRANNGWRLVTYARILVEGKLTGVAVFAQDKVD